MVEEFTSEKELIRVKLRGRHELVLEAKKDRAALERFKAYLIEGRNRARQRELSFVHSQLEAYTKDNAKIIA